MDRIDAAFTTMFAERDERTAQAALLEGLPVDGSFYQQEVKQRRYWHHRSCGRTAGKALCRCVGPSEPKLDDRIGRDRASAPMRIERRRMVTVLKRTGLPAVDRYAGNVIATLAKTGPFRLRAILIGTAAYPTFAVLLGVRLPSANMTTQDGDVAQFYAIAMDDVSARRTGLGRLKAAKDLAQAAALIEARHVAWQMDVLADAFDEARDRGPAWIHAIDRSLAKLPAAIRAVLP